MPTLWGVSHYLKGQIIPNSGLMNSGGVCPGFLAAVLSTGKDFAFLLQLPLRCSRQEFSVEHSGQFSELVGTCALLLAQAADPWAGEQAEGDFPKLLPLSVLPQPFGACRQEGWGGHCSK